MSGAFARKWTAQQKNAIKRATCDDRMSAPAARKAAQMGELPGLDAFDMPLTTVRDIAKMERRRRAGTDLSPLAGQPKLARQSLVDRLLTIQERAIDHLLSQSNKGGGRRNVDPDVFQKTLRNQAELDKLLAAVQAEPGPPNKAGREGDAHGRTTLAERLAAEARKQAQPPKEPRPAPPTFDPTKALDAPEPTATTPEPTPEHQTDTENQPTTETKPDVPLIASEIEVLDLPEERVAHPPLPPWAQATNHAGN